LTPAFVAASELPAGTSPGAAAPVSAEQAWAAIEPEALSREAQPLKRSPARREASTAGEPRAGSGGSWLRTWGALAGVVTLILLLAWGYRVVTSGGLPLARARHPGLIEVVSRLGLSPRHALFLVRVGPRLVLCGVSQERISVLDSIDDPELTARLAGQAAAAREDSSLATFRRCLESEERGVGRGESGATWGAGPDGGGLTGTGRSRLGAARRSLSGAIERIRTVANAG
jgi:flagellar biogenesis protein FliO